MFVRKEHSKKPELQGPHEASYVGDNHYCSSHTAQKRLDLEGSGGDRVFDAHSKRFHCESSIVGQKGLGLRGVQDSSFVLQMTARCYAGLLEVDTETQGFQ